MRSMVPMASLLILGAVSIPVCASSLDDKPFDQQSINALAAKASQAQPKERCFLYAELMHQMTEFSLRQYAAGDVQQTAILLKQIQGLAHQIHLSVAEDNKRLKNAEILMRHTAYRLNEMLHASSLEDRPLVQETLLQVSRAQSEAMLQVFRK